MTTPEPGDALNNDAPKSEATLKPAAVVRSFRWLVLLALAIVAGGMMAIHFWPLPVIDTIQDGDIEEPVASVSGYLGPQACAPCHARRVEEFQKTSHFRACRLPKNGDMPPGFAPGKGKHVYDPALRFEMIQKDGDFLQIATRATADGEQSSKARIDFAYGAAKADEVFFSWRGDQLFELPVVWLHPLNRWANSTINPHGSGDFSRETTIRCLECHNTYFEHQAGTRNEYKRNNFILGVTCERCHGPGQEHVAYHQADPQAETATAIVRPDLLARERQLEVCTQCHSNAIKARGPAFQYRPGEPLDAYFRTITSKYPELDHVANQVQYLRQSKCFQKSNMTCTTCHDPHRPHDSRISRSEQKCLQCHKPVDCRERDRLPQPVQGNCLACHMPQRVWMNVHFHTEEDRYVPPIRRFQHRIAVDPTARQEVLLAWHRTQSDPSSHNEADRLRKALVEHWLKEADARRQEFRFLAAIGAIREALRVESTPSSKEKLRAAVARQAKLDRDLVDALHLIDERRLPAAIEALQKILAVKPDLAIAHGKLGTAYGALGKKELAIEHLQMVAKCDPDDPYGFMGLGWLAFLQGRWEDAVSNYRRADDIEPFNSKTNYHWGLALSKLGRWEEAGERFRHVLIIDPKHAGGYQGQSQALRQQGRAAEALHCARRAAVLTRFRNADILVTLTEAYVAAGQIAEARSAAAKAFDAVKVSNPTLEPELRRRLDEILAGANPAPKK